MIRMKLERSDCGYIRNKKTSDLSKKRSIEKRKNKSASDL